MAGAPVPLIFAGSQFKYMVPWMGMQWEQSHFQEDFNTASGCDGAIGMILQLIQS